MRLIDTDALLKVFEKYPNDMCTKNFVFDKISNAPTIEPRNIIACEEVDELDMLERMYAEPSGDLVSREDAIKAVEQEYKIDKGYMADDYTYGFNQAIQYVSDIILHDLPSADTMSIEEHQTIVTELKRSAVRPKGEWTRKEDKVSWWVECSNCGSKPLLDVYNHEYVKSNFCPNCGAEMKGGGE